MSQFADPDGWLDRQDMVAGRDGSGVGEGGRVNRVVEFYATHSRNA